MVRLPATVSASIAASILGLAVLAMPTTSLAQSSGGGTGGSSGSATSGATGSGSVTTGTAGAGSPSGMAPPPGTNSLGTAQSSGGTVGMGSGGDRSVDQAVDAENKQIDKTVKSICRGC
nr:hypothetical protein [Bradyrhizobium iriomotense]